MFDKQHFVAAFSGVGLAVIIGFVLALLDFRVRDDVFVWMVWCIPGALIIPLIRVGNLNAFVSGMLLAGFFVFGFLGAGVVGPSTIAGGFAAVWAVFVAILLLFEWAIIRRFWPLSQQMVMRHETENVKPSRDSGNPYQPPN